MKLVPRERPCSLCSHGFHHFLPCECGCEPQVFPGEEAIEKWEEPRSA